MDKKQPGVMLYFDIRPCLNRMNREEQGDLFVAILDYAQYGVVPELDGVLGVAWDFIQPRLDRDREKYEQITVQRNYAAYSRETKRRGDTPLSFDDWKATSDNESLRVVTNDDEPLPTTTSNTNTNTSPSTTTATTATTTPTSTSASTPTGERSRDEEFERMRRERMGMLMK